jgi:hypothetical protein
VKKAWGGFTDIICGGGGLKKVKERGKLVQEKARKMKDKGKVEV